MGLLLLRGELVVQGGRLNPVALAVVGPAVVGWHPVEEGCGSFADSSDFEQGWVVI